MFNKLSLLALLNVAIIGKKIKLFKYQSGKHILYHTVKDVKFTGPKRNHPKPMGEAIAEIISMEGEHIPYKGDWMSLKVKVGEDYFDLSINSVTDILIIA